MGRYRSRSRTPPPRGRKRYDDDRYGDTRSHRDRRSPRPSGLLVRNLPLDASRRNEGGSRRRARSISPRPYSRPPSPAREESKTRKLTKKWDSKKDISAPLAQSRARAHQLIIRDKRVELDGMLREYGIIAKKQHELDILQCHPLAVDHPMMKDLNEKRKAYYNFLKTTERQYMLCQFTQEFVDMRVQIDVHDDYLRSSFERKLDEQEQHELLLNRALLRDGGLLRDGDKVDELNKMHRHYRETPTGLDFFANIFKQLILDEGTTLVELAEKSGSSFKQVLVRQLTDLHDKFMSYICTCFMSDVDLDKALMKAFQALCNKTIAGVSSAEFLSSVCDNILRKGGSEKMTDKAREEILEKVVKLLLYISDKDIFEYFHRKKLARRLLSHTSVGDYHEVYILTKLKWQFGGTFTRSMERMVQDLNLTRDNQSEFREYLEKNKDVNTGIDLKVSVLNRLAWPSYRSSDLKLPPEMVKCVEAFKGFYATKTKNRKLTWIYSLETCAIIGKFDKKDIELIVSPSQAAVLLLFNTADNLSYSEIKTQLNLTKDLDRLLHSLSCAKYKILVKKPDSFEFNYNFIDKRNRITIPLPHVDDEREKVVKAVVKERQYVIEAVIVRLMKRVRTMSYETLFTRCGEMLQHLFMPDHKAIKDRIEDLIHREYLARDKDDKNTLWYLV